MSKLNQFVSILLIGLFLMISGCNDKDLQNSIKSSAIYRIDSNVFSGGQPSQAEFHQLKKQGLKTVINLRSPAEVDWDEKALLTELGIKYINLPIEGAAGITQANAQALMSLIDENNDGSLLVHCGSGNRVGALIATADYINNQSDIEESIAEGKKWGLTGLEPTVRELLQSTQ